MIFLDPTSYEKALEGVHSVFLMRPPSLSKPKRDMLPFLKAAKAAGIKKIVFISLLGVEKNPFPPHGKIEKMIKDLKINYVFLRPSFFMQNLNTNHLEEIKDRDELFIPAGQSKTSFVDTRDIASAAAITLLEDKYQNLALDLTGKEAIDYDEIAEILSEVLERNIQYKTLDY